MVVSLFFWRGQRTSEPSPLKAATASPAASRLAQALKAALHDDVVLPDDGPAFKESADFYWAQQEREVVPACFVCPRNTQQLRSAILILKQVYDERMANGGFDNGRGLFAIRSGGHSPVSRVASIDDGVLIDLRFFNEVTPSEDNSSVTIGTGATWADVSRVLDDKGLAVAGGRNCSVGVGGLTLGGGISFHTPRFGLVCSNIISYEVVLASGSVTTASATSNPDLWRALKGGSNNFGIVTRFIARSFPSTKIWSGYLFAPNFQVAKSLKAFYECVGNLVPEKAGSSYDHHAAGPLLCFTYLQKLRIRVISVQIAYTKLPENENQWPNFWKSSLFSSLWRFWSTFKVQTLGEATEELNTRSVPGQRQIFTTTTTNNDPSTLAAAHAAHDSAVNAIRRMNVKGLIWTMVMQPLLPDWARKGDPNPLGLDSTLEPLVVIIFTTSWEEEGDDDLVKTTTRRAIDEIEAFAAAKGTGHRFRYLNYCDAWQRPFDGYGVENLQFLRGVSRKYDSEGFFQKGCVGGFKLDVMDG